MSKRLPFSHRAHRRSRTSTGKPVASLRISSRCCRRRCSSSRGSRNRNSRSKSSSSKSSSSKSSSGTTLSHHERCLPLKRRAWLPAARRPRRVEMRQRPSSSRGWNQGRHPLGKQSRRMRSRCTRRAVPAPRRAASCHRTERQPQHTSCHRTLHRARGSRRRQQREQRRPSSYRYRLLASSVPLRVSLPVRLRGHRRQRTTAQATVQANAPRPRRRAIWMRQRSSRCCRSGSCSGMALPLPTGVRRTTCGSRRSSGAL